MTERYYAFKEMLDKEQAFNQQLDYVLLTMRPAYQLKENPHDANALTQTIFGALSPIYDLSSQLLGLLKDAYSQNPQDPHCASIFVKYAEKLVCYSNFILNQETSLKMLTERMKKSKKVKECIENCLATGDGKLISKDLYSIFLLPFQHLCRYKLYLDRLLKASQNHPEYPTLKEALLHTIGSINLVNQFHGEQSNRQKLKEIQAKLDFSSYELVKTSTAGSSGHIDIVTSNRELCDERDVWGLKTGKVSFLASNAKLYHFFIFNDMVIVASEQTSIFSREVRYKVKKIFYIDALFQAIFNDAARNAAEAHPHQFIIKYTQRNTNYQSIYAAQTSNALTEILKKFDALVTKQREAVRGAQHEIPGRESRASSITTGARTPCELCLHPTRREKMQQCGRCLRNVCGQCYVTQHHPNMCVNCGQKQEIVPLHPSLIPAFRAYRCVRPAPVIKSGMIDLKVGDQLDVYYIVNQTWAFGRNTSQFNTCGVFYLGNCALDSSRDLGARQNMGLFAGIYEPDDIPTPRLSLGNAPPKFFPGVPTVKESTPSNTTMASTPEHSTTTRPSSVSVSSHNNNNNTSNTTPLSATGPRHTFSRPLDIGDVLVVTSIAGEQSEWYFAQSLRTSKFGYVHCDDVKIIPGTTIPSVNDNSL